MGAETSTVLGGARHLTAIIYPARPLRFATGLTPVLTYEGSTCEQRVLEPIAAVENDGRYQHLEG